MEETFEREKACYEQNFEQFRSLNQIMWQVPIIAMTLTGGLWFGAANVGSMPGFQVLLLSLGALANLGLILVLTRVRYVMGEYLKAIKQFYPDRYVAAESTRWSQSRAVVATTFRCLLAVSALISLVGIAIVAHAAGREPSGRRVIQVIELDRH